MCTDPSHTANNQQTQHMHIPMDMQARAQPRIPEKDAPTRVGGVASAGANALLGPYEWVCMTRCGLQQSCSREDSDARGRGSMEEAVTPTLLLVSGSFPSSGKTTGTMAASMVARKLRHTRRKSMTWGARVNKSEGMESEAMERH
jgi:hypothetical protein